MKVLRVIMLIAADKKATKFKTALQEHGVVEAVEQLVHFEMEPDAEHGDAPQKMIRAAAQKCIELLADAAGGAPGKLLVHQTSVGHCTALCSAGLRRTVLVWRAVQRCTALPSPCQPQADDSEQSDKVMTGHLTD